MSRNNFVSFYAVIAITAASFCWIGTGRLRAQGATATVLGTVTDMSGAAVPGASIQIKNLQTGIAQSATSDSQGRFRVPDLAVGNYDAQAGKEGFSTVVHKAIPLTVGSETVVDFSLPIGQQQQTVTVEGQVSQVETTNAAIGQYTSQQQMSDLPLNGRNFEQLIQLSPGVAPAPLTQSAMQGRALQYSIAGGRPEGQAILLDDENLQGFWNNGMGSVSGSSLGVEAIGEFQTLTNAYGAQFGGNGAVVNAVSKSGSNSFHGSAFDYLRNSALDARDFFAAHVSPFRRNQFGGSVGGPVKKDKAFFFVDYEGIRQFFEENKTATVPACIVPGVCTITATNPAVATAIANSLALFPKPTALVSATTGIAPQYGNQTDHENYMLARFDYTFSDKDSLFLRYFLDKASFLEPFGGAGIAGGGPLLGWNEQDGSFSHFATLEERHVFSPTVVNTARISFSRPEKDSHQTTIDSLNGPIPIGTNPCGSTTAYCPQTPLQYWPNLPGNYDGLLEIQGGLTNLGGSAISVFNLTQNRYTAADDILWTHGAHTFRFGASVSRTQSNTNNPLKGDAIWVFASFAQFLAGGTAQSVEGVIPSPANYSNRDYRQVDFDPYVQDDWKVSQKLTVNLGARWEFYTNPNVLHNALYEISNIQTSTGFSPFNTVFGTNPSWHDIDPRVGIAYDPFANHKTSIRAGFGLFHDPIVGLDYQIGIQSSPPWQDNVQANPATFPTPFTGGGALSAPTAAQGWLRDVDTTPYVEQYNLNIQHEVISNTVVTVAYVGSHGVHLFSGIDKNPPIPTTANGLLSFGHLAVPGNNFSYVVNPRINPNFGPYIAMEPISTSEYNSLQVLVNRRFSQNFQATLNYTHSKCTDDGALGIGTINGALNTTPGSVMDPYNQALDHGVCSYDLPDVLRINALYSLPFHKNRVVSGWQLTGIVSKYSGAPFTVGTGFSNTVDPNGDAPRPNYVAGCDPYAGAKTVQEWFNPGCYVPAAPGTLGTAGRNTLRGPGFFDMDLGVLKDTKLTERVNMQFRAEFFNILNHENFALPVLPEPLALNPTGGLITATNQGSTPRQIQFALKLLF